MGNTILVIDDDDDLTESLQMLLSHEGFDVIVANLIEDGLKKFYSLNPELVILDLIFPESDTVGLETALEIKKKSPNIPVFVFTSINRNFVYDFRKENIQVDEYLVKPVNTNLLMEKIRKYLN